MLHVKLALIVKGGLVAQLNVVQIVIKSMIRGSDLVI